MKVPSGMSDGRELRSLEPEDLAQAFDYLELDPIRNLVFVGLLRTAAASDPRDSAIYGLWSNSILKGVGLLGSVAAWAGGADVAGALGKQARASTGPPPRLLVGLADEVEVFLETSADTRTGRTDTYLLYTLEGTEFEGRSASGISLRRARREELEDLFRIHVELYVELVQLPLPDPEASKRRLLRRIEEDRVWVADDGDRIIFKADVATETRNAVLIEAVWTDPQLRGQGIGENSLKSLCAHLLSTYPNICLFLGNEQSRLKDFYTRLGFRYQTDRGDYTVIRYSAS